RFRNLDSLNDIYSAFSYVLMQDGDITSPRSVSVAKQDNPESYEFIGAAWAVQRGVGLIIFLCTTLPVSGSGEINWDGEAATPRFYYSLYSTKQNRVTKEWTPIAGESSGSGTSKEKQEHFIDVSVVSEGGMLSPNYSLKVTNSLQEITDIIADMKEVTDMRSALLTLRMNGYAYPAIEIQSYSQQAIVAYFAYLGALTKANAEFAGYDKPKIFKVYLEITEESDAVTSVEEIEWPFEQKVKIERAEGESLKAEPGKCYTFNSKVNNLSIELQDDDISSEYLSSLSIFFSTGDAPNVVLYSKDGNPFAEYSGYAIEANTSYELNIMWNGENWVVAYAVIE
ncbi:MAG: hypothetical protein J1E95_11260, partial [Muribaculaceae bacterium]|nr:hypothetical protein [Muribaculaceae bacterium]